MAKLVINLSASNGLTERWHQELPFASSKPELRILGKDTQIAEGIVNPMRLYGYLGPANASTTAMLMDGGSQPILFSSYAVQEGANAIYVGEYNVGATSDSRIIKLTSFNDTTFDSVHSVSNATSYPIVTDMTRYIKNNAAAIMYSWRASSSPNSQSDMGHYDFSTWTDTYLSGTATSGAKLGLADHRLVLAENTMLYI